MLILFDKKAPQAYLNGAVHWSATDKSSGRHLVLLFGFGDDLFRLIELPDGVGSDLSLLLSISPTVFLEDLALIEYIANTAQEKWRVWVMREYGVAESFTAHLGMVVDPVLQRMIGFRKSGELLIERSGRQLQYFFNPVSCGELQRVTCFTGETWLTGESNLWRAEQS